MKLTSGNIVIGDITEASKYFSLVKQMKAEMKRLHGKDRPWMQSWQTVGPGVKVHIKLIMGEPKAYIYVIRDAYVWGSNNWGELGFNNLIPISWTQYYLGYFRLPLPLVVKQEKCIAVSAGRDHSFILTSTGDLFGAGSNGMGQLGIGSAYGAEPGLHYANTIWEGLPPNQINEHPFGYDYYIEFTQIPGKFTAVSAGYHFSLALNNTDLYWWGGLFVPEGVYIDSFVPKLIGTDFVKIECGRSFGLMLKSNGDVYSIGSNSSGKLGIGGSRSTIVTEPVFVDSGYKDISAGATHALGLKIDGTVMAWGIDDSEIAFGFLSTPLGGYYLTPISIGMDDCKFVCAALGHSYAIKNNGDLYVLGASTAETPIGLPYPKTYAIEWEYVDSGYESVSCDTFHALAIKSNGDLVSWGINENGELGVVGDEFGEHSQSNQPWFSSLGRIGLSYIPTLVGTDFVSASAGDGHSMAIRNGPPKGDFPVFKSRGVFYLP